MQLSVTTITTRTIKGDTGTAVFEIADLMSDSVVSTSGAGGAWTFGVGRDAWTKVVTRFTGNDGSKWTRTQEYRDVFRMAIFQPEYLALRQRP